MRRFFFNPTTKRTFMNSLLAGIMFRMHERMLGRNTFKVLSQLRRSQYWTREQIQKLRLARLRQLVRDAHDHCPFWRRVMIELGIDPGDIRDIKDIAAFGLLSREDIRQHREEMVWRHEGRGVTIATTSGSTNARLQFYTSASRESHITAARMRGHGWVGVEPGDKELYFWAAPLEVNTQDRLRQVRDWLRNDAFSNGLLLTPQRVRRYFSQWMKWKPRCIFGYVSSFAMMVRLANQCDIDLSLLARRGLRAIVTTSELLGDHRSIISQAFGVPVYDSFGLREGGLIAHDCYHCTMHTNDEQLILETINPNTLEPTTCEGELVVTMLMSNAMPIIRYRTGDLVSLSEPSCACGLSLGSICMRGGRIMESLITTEGNIISAVSLLYTCKAIPALRQLQARQERLGEIRLLVALEDDAPHDTMKRVEHAMRKRLDSQDKLIIQQVDEIPPVASGKQMVVISQVARDMFASTNPAVR